MLNKFNSLFKYSSRIVASLLLSTILTTFFASGLKAQTPASSATQNEKQDSASESNQRERKSILATIWKLLEAKRKPEPALVSHSGVGSSGSSRTKAPFVDAIAKMLKDKRQGEPNLSSRSNICEVAPGLLEEVNIIYSDRPLFMWQGETNNAQVNLYNPFSLEKEQDVLWSRTVTEQSQQLAYDGKPLRTGLIYDWEIVTQPESNRRRISFQVMSGEERQQITAGLTELENELKTSEANAEEITLAKAYYFAHHGLWSDALQELSSLERQSHRTQAIIKSVCTANSEN